MKKESNPVPPGVNRPAPPSSPPDVVITPEPLTRCSAANKFADCLGRLPMVEDVRYGVRMESVVTRLQGGGLIISDFNLSIEPTTDGQKMARKPKYQSLSKELARAIGVDTRDYDDEVTELLVVKGKGVYWSEDLHLAAKELAAKVVGELEQASGYLD